MNGRRDPPRSDIGHLLNLPSWKSRFRFSPRSKNRGATGTSRGPRLASFRERAFPTRCCTLQHPTPGWFSYANGTFSVSSVADCNTRDRFRPEWTTLTCGHGPHVPPMVVSVVGPAYFHRDKDGVIHDNHRGRLLRRRTVSNPNVNRSNENPW